MLTNIGKLSKEMLIEQAHNKSLKDIENTCYFLRESIRQYLSRLLMDYTEDNVFVCNIVVETEDDFGLSDELKTRIIAMYQLATEGTIWLRFEGDEVDYNIDDMFIDALMDIVRAIDNYTN